MPHPVITEESMRDLALGVLASQYGNAERMRTLLLKIALLLWREIGIHAVMLMRWAEVDSCEGIVLDYLGRRLGMERPFSESQDVEWFGFQGTESDLGATFDMAPFYSLSGHRLAGTVVGDVSYREILRWRARAIVGSPSHGGLRETIGNLRNVSLSESANTLTVTSGSLDVGVETTVWEILSSASYHTQSSQIFPRVSGQITTFVTS